MEPKFEIKIMQFMQVIQKVIFLMLMIIGLITEIMVGKEEGFIVQFWLVSFDNLVTEATV